MCWRHAMWRRSNSSSRTYSHYSLLTYRLIQRSWISHWLSYNLTYHMMWLSMLSLLMNHLMPSADNPNLTLIGRRIGNHNWMVSRMILHLTCFCGQRSRHCRLRRILDFDCDLTSVWLSLTWSWSLFLKFHNHTFFLRHVRLRMGLVSLLILSKNRLRRLDKHKFGSLDR